jgi:iron complex transport system permease protein
MKRKLYKYLALGLVFAGASFTAGIFFGSTGICIKEIFSILASKIPFIGDLITKTRQENAENIILKIRLPRAVTGLIVGASLSMAGAVYQSMLKNPLADPYLLGISSGAALGASAAILLSVPLHFLGVPAVPVFAFLGSLASMFVVYGLARTKGKIPSQTLILSGVIVNFTFSALMMLLIVFSGKGHSEAVYWMMGSLNNSSYALIPYVLPAVAAIGLVIYYYSGELNIMSIGEETAASLGVETEKVKKTLFIVTSLITSLAVSISGLIGFVGLIIPHTARLIAGPDHRALIPFSALLGGGFLILADLVSRTAAAPSEIPVGIITALLGGPFFLYLLKRKQK